MAAGKHDVELAKIERFTALGGQAIDAARWVLGIAATWLPLSIIQNMVEDVAGKETRVDANIAFSAVVSLSVVWNVGQYLRGQQRKSTIKEQRTRITTLESQLGLRDTEGA